MVSIHIPLDAVIDCLAGAACYAVSSVLQQHAASAQPVEMSMRPSLIVSLSRSGPWIAGIVLDAAGFAFQLFALRQAALALVEPLFVVGLLFSIVGAAIYRRRRPTGGEWWASSLVVAGLILFIAAARPGPGHPHASNREWGIMFAVTLVLVAGAVLLATGSPRRRALLLGTGTGLLFGVTAPIVERTGHLLNGGVLHALSSWAPYSLAIVSILGLLLHQSAYQAGDLRLSLPVLTVLEPIVAVIIGQVLFGEHIASSPLAIAGQVAGLLAMVVGVFHLARLTVPEQVVVRNAQMTEESAPAVVS